MHTCIITLHLSLQCVTRLVRMCVVTMQCCGIRHIQRHVYEDSQKGMHTYIVILICHTDVSV